jgi:hypothetical protein
VPRRQRPGTKPRRAIRYERCEPHAAHGELIAAGLLREALVGDYRRELASECEISTQRTFISRSVACQ